MTYRDRRAARVERLREWAEKREQKATAQFAVVHQISDMIPMGQPILVSHHSEGRARRDQDRIHNGTRAAIDHARTAERMNEKADNIEAAADHAIYSDDPDAIDRLQERIATLEGERESIKAYNRSCRAGARDVSLLDEAQLKALLIVLKYSPYQTKNGAIPSYALTNLSGNISRLKKRLQGFER
jgi:Domain of unknown function (DUF3560)